MILFERDMNLKYKLIGRQKSAKHLGGKNQEIIYIEAKPGDAVESSFIVDVDKRWGKQMQFSYGAKMFPPTP